MLRSKRLWLTTAILLAAALAGWRLSASAWRATSEKPSSSAPSAPAAAIPAQAVDLTVAAAGRSAGRPADDPGWPNLFGPTLNSISTEQNIAADWPEGRPPVLWRAAVGEGYSSPIAEGGDVLVFHRPTKVPGDSPPADLQPGEADHGKDEVLTCFASESGSVRWEFRHPTAYRCSTHYSSGPYATPTLDAKHVYACGTEGNFYCLSRADGTLVWKRELWKDFGRKQEGFFPVTGSPLLIGDRLVLNLGAVEAGAGVVALDKATGQTLWQATDQAASYATPSAATIHGRDFVFVFTAEALVALDPQTGHDYWQVKFRANNPELVNATSPIVYQDIVFTSGYALGNLCLQVQPDGSYKELWRDKRRNLDSQYNPLTCIDGRLYGFAALDDTFRCLDLATGDVLWKGLREIERGSFIAADGHFLILGTEGHLASVRIDPRQLQVVAKTKEPVIAAPAYSFPALARGRLFLRNEKELVCLDVGPAR